MTSPNAQEPRQVPPDIDEIAAYWWLQQQEGLSSHATARRDAWLAQDPRHARALATMADAAARLDRLPAATRRHARQPRWGYAATAPAARIALLAACLLLGVGWQWHAGQATPLAEHLAQTRRGELQDLSLSDGSLVALDTGSSVRATLYRNRREVVLEQGQALFDVRRDVDRPFRVVAGDAQVTVLGTRFNVRRDGDATIVAVADGHVEVSAHGSTRQLSAGDVLRIHPDHGATLERQAIQLIAAWRERQLVFDNMPLPQALGEFSRYGEIPVRLADRRLEALRITGTFDARRPEQFAAALPQVLPVVLERNGQQVLARYREP